MTRGSLVALLLGCTAAVACGGTTPSQSDDRPLVSKADGKSSWAKPGPRSGAVYRSTERSPRRQPNTISESLLNRILRGGPGLLLSLVPLKPVLGTNRRFQGFEIVRVHDNSPRILRYGVRPGDRLLKVNGIAIVRPDDMMKLFSRLENASELVVEVRRDGQRRRVAIPIVPDKASTTSPQTP